MYKAQYKLGSVLLAMALIFALGVPAFAAEDTQPLTYDQRVQAIKDAYGITYEYATYYTNTPEAKEYYLTMTEDALAYLGASFVRKVSSVYTSQGTPFYIRIGVSDANRWKFSQDFGTRNGWQTGNVVEYLPQSFSMSYEELDEADLRSYRGLLAHELLHTYDRQYLNGGGHTELYNVLSTNKDFANVSYGPDYEHGYGGMGNYMEAFANMGELMLCYEPFDENIYLDTWMTKDNFTIIYDMLLRDFGADSIVVKRAAKFLGL